MSAEQIAERTGLGRKTIYNIEQGSPTVAIGSYLQALFVLGLEKDLSLVAATDPLGRKLQDAGILTKKRAPKQAKKSWSKTKQKCGFTEVKEDLEQLWRRIAFK